MRIFDGHWNLIEVVECDQEHQFQDVENKAGSGSLLLRGDLWIARWLWDAKGRMDAGQMLSVFIVVDYVGWRWSGRLDDCVARTDEMGNSQVEAVFQHDMQIVNDLLLWATPSCPAGFQPIKVFMCGGPTDWALGTAAWLNLARAWGYPSGWTSDPLGRTDYDYTNWPVVFEPLSYSQAVARGTTTGLVISRFKTFGEASEQMLEDAEVSVRVRRYLPGDDLPWPGAQVSYGTLVVSFVPSGGKLSEDTSGGLAEGIGQLVRIWISSVVEGIGGGSLPIEDGQEALTGQPVPPAYQQPGYLGTDPMRPYALYTRDTPGLVDFEAHLRPAKYVRLTAGGHSAPMVNELISALVQGIGDAVAAIPLAPIPPLGGMADAILKPFYTDVILAFMTVRLMNRSQQVSKHDLYEMWVDGADKAYTLSATMVLRAAMKATETQFSASLKIIDGAPWWVGEQGQGDITVGTRIYVEDPISHSGRIYAPRVKKLQLDGKRGQGETWEPTVGDLEPGEDPLVRAMRRIKKLMEGLKMLGVL